MYRDMTVLSLLFIALAPLFLYLAGQRRVSVVRRSCVHRSVPADFRQWSQQWHPLCDQRGCGAFCAQGRGASSTRSLAAPSHRSQPPLLFPNYKLQGQQ